MTKQKTLKRRVRARAAKTGESYTASRAQLLRKARATPPSSEPATDLVALTGISNDAMVRGSGRAIGGWIPILDGWGATEHRHPEIVAWLVAEHGVPGWWAQMVTVAYERARGMRAPNERTDGFSVSVSKTIDARRETLTDALTDPVLRERWLPAAPIRARTVQRGRSGRFDWDEPPSRIGLYVEPKGEARAQIVIAHEKLPDAASVEQFRAFWRERLAALKEALEAT